MATAADWAFAALPIPPSPRQAVDWKPSPIISVGGGLFFSYDINAVASQAESNVPPLATALRYRSPRRFHSRQRGKLSIMHFRFRCSRPPAHRRRRYGVHITPAAGATVAQGKSSAVLSLRGAASYRLSTRAGQLSVFAACSSMSVFRRF